MAVEKILGEALALPPEERARIATALLDGLPPEEWEQAWAAEVERRVKDLDEGRIRAIPGEEVFRGLAEVATRVEGASLGAESKKAVTDAYDSAFDDEHRDILIETAARKLLTRRAERALTGASVGRDAMAVATRIIELMPVTARTASRYD